MLLVNGMFTVPPEQIEAEEALVITGPELLEIVSVKALAAGDWQPAPFITEIVPL